jgi:hypothetical protein
MSLHSLQQGQSFRSACLKANDAFVRENQDPADLIDVREVFYLSIVDRLDLLKKDVKLVDLGGGFARFAPVASQLGVDAGAAPENCRA